MAGWCSDRSGQGLLGTLAVLTAGTLVLAAAWGLCGTAFCLSARLEAECRSARQGQRFRQALDRKLGLVCLPPWLGPAQLARAGFACTDGALDLPAAGEAPGRAIRLELAEADLVLSWNQGVGLRQGLAETGVNPDGLELAYWDLGGCRLVNEHRD